MKEHNYEKKYGAVYKHSETGHHIDCEHPDIIGYDKMKIRYSASNSLNVN